MRGRHPQEAHGHYRRVGPILNHWDRKVDPQVFNKINKHLGPLQVALFASRVSTQLEIFCSWRLDPIAWGMDAFLQAWGKLSFANLPWILIPRVLTQV